MNQADDGRPLPANDDQLWHRLLLDAVPDAVLVADHKGRYIDANNAATSLLGYSLDEFRTMHISAVSTLGIAEVTERHQYLVQEGVWTGAGTLRCKDGSHVSVEVRTTEVIGPFCTCYMALFRPLVAAPSNNVDQ